MKKIKCGETELLYVIDEYDCGDYGASFCYKTIFFDTKPMVRMVKKYYLFGDLIEKIAYKRLFHLDYSVECNRVTKDEVKKDIVRKITLLKRQEEIDNGEII